LRLIYFKSLIVEKIYKLYFSDSDAFIDLIFPSWFYMRRLLCCFTVVWT